MPRSDIVLDIEQKTDHHSITLGGYSCDPPVTRTASRWDRLDRRVYSIVPTISTRELKSSLADIDTQREKCPPPLTCGLFADYRYTFEW